MQNQKLCNVALMSNVKKTELQSLQMHLHYGDKIKHNDNLHEISLITEDVIDCIALNDDTHASFENDEMINLYVNSHRLPRKKKCVLFNKSTDAISTLFFYIIPNSLTQESIISAFITLMLE